MRWALGLVLLAPMLSGCTDDAVHDQLSETWIVSVRSDGPFEVAFPIALHDDGPDLEGWAARFDADVGEGTLRQEGGSLVLNGTGFVTMEAHFRTEADRLLEGHLDATWSDGQGAAGEGAVQVELRSGGPIETMSLRTEAVSRHCSLERNHYAVFEGVGTHALPGGAHAVCS